MIASTRLRLRWTFAPSRPASRPHPHDDVTPSEAQAVDAAVRAVRAYADYDEGLHAGYPGPNAVDALEDRLGPLDWSRFDGRGYRLLRAVKDRIFGVRRPERTDPAGDRALNIYDRTETGRRRLAWGWSKRNGV